MERFNYPNLEAVYAEDGDILLLLEYEHYGRGLDQEEKLAAIEAEAEAARMQNEQ